MTAKRRKRPKPPPYEDVRHLLTYAARAWFRLYRDDEDALLSLADETYLKLCRTWPGTYEFAHCLRYRVWRAFQDRKRHEARRRRLMPTLSLSEYDVAKRALAPERSEFDVGAFTATLKGDAATAVGIALDPPRRVKAGFGKPPRQGHACPQKSTLRAYLTGHLGWSRRRVEDSFRKVREALV